MSSSFVDVLARKQAATVTVPVILDAQLREAVIAAEDRHQEALTGARFGDDGGQVARAAKVLAEAKAAARAQSVVFRFRAIGRLRFEQLRDSHPATDVQQADFRARLADTDTAAGEVPRLLWNPDTFPPALLAASCVDPVMSVADAEAMWESDDWSQSELAELFTAALTVNQTHRRVELGEG